jgi:hypothetical protein
MSPMRFPRVAILENNEIVEYGYLNKDMPQNDGSYLYEIYGDSSKLYIVKENEFLYVGENDESKW